MGLVRALERLLDVCDRAFLAIANACLIVMLIANSAQILSRALLGKGIAPVFPLTVFLFVWTTFFGFFVIYRRAADVTLDFFVEQMNAALQTLCRLFADGLTLLLMLVMVWYAPQVLSQQVGAVIELVGVDLTVQTTPLFVSCALIAVHSLLDIGRTLRGEPPRQRGHLVHTEGG